LPRAPHAISIQGFRNLWLTGRWRDRTAASAEYLAQFRSDSEVFAVAGGARTRSPGASYMAFVDPDGAGDQPSRGVVAEFARTAYWRKVGDATSHQTKIAAKSLILLARPGGIEPPFSP
jgi:hypothetical protein